MVKKFGESSEIEGLTFFFGVSKNTECGRETIFEEAMAIFFSALMKHTNLQIKSTQQIPNGINRDSHMTISQCDYRTLNMRGKIFKQPGEKKLYSDKCRLATDIITAVAEAKRLDNG